MESGKIICMEKEPIYGLVFLPKPVLRGKFSLVLINQIKKDYFNFLPNKIIKTRTSNSPMYESAILISIC